MKRIIGQIAIVVFSLALCGPAIAAGQDKGPEKITIDIDHAKKAVKNFPHRKHQEMMKGDCKSCHHKTKPGETPQSCGKCHTKAKETDPKTKAIGFKKAFHKKCLGCHKKHKDKPKLRKCKTCHGRK